MSYETQSRRLSLLKHLAGSSAYRSNESVIAQALDRFGFTVPRDAVRADIVWLAEQELVSIARVDGDYMIATLTARGDEVQSGRAQHPGIARPSAPRG